MKPWYLRCTATSWICWQESKGLKVHSLTGNKSPGLGTQCEAHNVFTEKVSEIANSANDNKRMQIPAVLISYPYGVHVGILCKAELMRHPKIKNWI